MIRYLYHGTTRAVAKRILNGGGGLKPRGATGKDNWEHTVTSNADCVYLTNAYAPHFAHNAMSYRDKWGAVIEVDLAMLDWSKLRPDEDMLEQATRGSGSVDETIAAELEGKDMKGRTMWFRDNIDAFAHLWRISVDMLGTCGYRGTIPVSAIPRVAYFKPTANVQMFYGFFDPTISILNYKFCGGKYRAFTKWMFGGDVVAEDITMYPPEVAPEGFFDQLRQAMDAREGLQVVEIGAKKVPSRA